MANQWLRLWHDMPNDPKWRTIARVSKQSIPAVLSVYVHLLVIASNATERGRTQNVCSEDLASALDLDAEQVEAILAAMQGRVLDGEMVSGWSKRQVEREDGSSERAKAWREAQKEAKRTQPNATERKQTPDKDKDKEVNTSPNGFDEFYEAYGKKVGKKKAIDEWKKLCPNDDLQKTILSAASIYAASTELKYRKDPERWIKDQRWLDAESSTGNIFAGVV